MKLPHHKYIWYAAGLIGLDSLLFGSTNATSVPSFVVIIGFLSLAATIWAGFFGLLSLLGLYGLTIKYKWRLSLYLGALLGGVVALQSIGELSRRDVLVLLPLVALGYLYSAYAKTARTNFES